MRTQDDVEHLGTCAVMTLSSTTCRISVRQVEPCYSCSLCFDNLRLNRGMIVEGTDMNAFTELS